jgi:hypothetical protein
MRTICWTLFSCLLADDVERLFVDAQPKEDRMPHLTFTRPLCEFYLTHKLRNKPSGRSLEPHLLIERLFVGAQRLHRFIERLERRLIKASTDMPSVNPALLGLLSYRSTSEPKYLRDLRGSV